MENIIWAVVWFAILGGVFGLILAIASKAFAVKTDPKIPEIIEVLPGANCGGCGYSGCAALAEAIAKGEAKVSSCTVGGDDVAKKVAAVMGIEAEKAVRMRAQVMCSGTEEYALKKYVYDGMHDCVAAARLGGGSKLCPNGCIGLGSCAAVCPFGAIKVKDGIAAVDYELCKACGKCVDICPKQLIKLIPYESKHWVGCKSADKGVKVKSYCDVGCIACHLCEKSCEHGAITVSDFVASIDYSKCVQCGKCVDKCPRKIIWSDRTQRISGVTIKLG